MNEADLVHDLTWPEIAAALFAARGIKKGLWRVAAKLRFAGLTTEWPIDQVSPSLLPTGMIGIEGLAIFEADEPGPMVFDAAVPGGGAAPSKDIASKSPVKSLKSSSRSKKVPARD